MVFKRRDRRSLWQLLREAVWPRGGWSRAYSYVKHRVRRLPDTPERISRGVWAGVFASWTPLFGFHIIIALLLAKVMRGNLLASVLGTFFGNPLTYLPIAIIGIQIGHFLLGSRPAAGFETGVAEKFSDAGRDIWHNLTAIFSHQQMDWDGLAVFYREIFLPFLVGGIIPGVISATICYYIFVPLIGAYQNRRRKKLAAKLDLLRKNAQDSV